MRFSRIAVGLAAVASWVSATPVVTKEGDVTTITETVTVYADCSKVKPKVFIISMV